MKISLLCPSRERLNKFLTFTSSVFTTVSNIKNIEIVLGVDEDDPKFYDYNRIAKNLDFINFVAIEEGLFDREGLSGIWNFMVTKTDGDILAMVGDDMVFKTNDWDEKIINTFQSEEDPLWLVHCNDGMRGPGNKYANVPPLAVNSFVHREYVNTVGRYVQTEVKEIFQDTFLDRLFESLDRKKYYHDILIKHLHYSEFGTEDQTTCKLEETRKGLWDNEKLFEEKLMPILKSEFNLIKTKYNI